ncbi:MAG: hypothetical protein ABEJ60_06290 [Halodesulfurarchaeum sp.]
MVEEEIHDADRIAALLRAEIEGLSDPPLDALTVQVPDAEPPAFVVTDDAGPVFEATTQDDRVVLDFRREPAAVAASAREGGLPARPKATTPPGTVVFLERAAAVKRVIDVLRAALGSQ